MSDGGFSIVALPSTAQNGAVSRIVSHLSEGAGVATTRGDVNFVITEYGIADLRGKTDAEVAAALIQVADSRFQDELVRQAKRAGKLPEDYVVPERFRNNYPEVIRDRLAPFKAQGLFAAFPFGTDFTPEELVLGKILKGLKAKTRHKGELVKTLLVTLDTPSQIPAAARSYLARLGIDQPSGLRERMLQRVVLSELISGGHV